MMMGRDLLPEEGVPGNDHAVILSHRLWRERFHADSHILGQQIRIDDEGYTVVWRVEARPSRHFWVYDPIRSEASSYLLHPPLFDENGLYSALTWYLQGLLERSDLEVQLDIAKEFGRLPREMELVIFRLVQECLTNVPAIRKCDCVDSDCP